MAWDDVTVKRGVCTDPGTCNFEGGLCGWSDVTQYGNNSWLWLVAEEASNGVNVDHTTESGSGRNQLFI